MRHQHGRRRGANRRNDAPGKMELTYCFNQQRAVAKALRTLNAAGQNKDIEIAIGHFDQRRIGQQLNAARADMVRLPSLATLAVVTFTPPRTSKSMVVTASVSSLPGARQISADALIFILLTLYQFKQAGILRYGDTVGSGAFNR